MARAESASARERNRREPLFSSSSLQHVKKQWIFPTRPDAAFETHIDEELRYYIAAFNDRWSMKPEDVRIAAEMIAFALTSWMLCQHLIILTQTLPCGL